MYCSDEEIFPTAMSPKKDAILLTRSPIEMVSPPRKRPTTEDDDEAEDGPERKRKMHPYFRYLQRQGYFDI